MIGVLRYQRTFSTSIPRKSQNHYEVLGLSVNATADEIKRRFFDLSKQYHPDRNTEADPEKYQQITQAYTVLSSDTDRRKFDDSLGAAVRKPQGYHSGRTWGSSSTAQHRRPGASGYSYNSNSHMRSHKARNSSKLDPLKPQHQNTTVPHFDFARHAQNHLRYDEYRRASYAKKHARHKSSDAFRGTAATASMGNDKPSDPQAAWNSFALRAVGITTASMSLVYLLFR